VLEPKFKVDDLVTIVMKECDKRKIGRFLPIFCFVEFYGPYDQIFVNLDPMLPPLPLYLYCDLYEKL